jgi:hypothetical protein
MYSKLSKHQRSMMANMKFKMGMITMPIMCTTIIDALEAASGMIKGALANETMIEGNQTNATQGMLMDMMMASGMKNMSQADLKQINDFVICSPADEKTMKSMMK